VVQFRELFMKGLQKLRGLVRRNERHKVPLAWILLRAGKGITRAAENPVERVVIAGGEGIVLVIVAPRARERKTPHRLAHRVQGVFDREVRHPGDAETARDRDESRGDHLLAVFRVGTGRQQVARNLLPQELIIRPVPLE
jgi:hypothetical protein